MKRIILCGCLCCCLVLMAFFYELKLVQIENRYKEKHQQLTDDEIEIYEYVFAIKCDSTCYH